MQTILAASGLQKRYSDAGPAVINELSASFARGDFTVIMGSSGSGKSTLLYLLCGLDKPTAGGVTYQGRNISSLSEKELAVLRRRAMGFVFQDAGLVPQLSLLENIAVPGCLVNKNRKAVIDRARALMERVGIASLEARLPAQVSGGEQQRCAIARALINEPEIIFADEPTGNLNSAHSKAVLDILSELNESGQTIVMVTHEVKAACRGGKILFLLDGQVRDFFTPRGNTPEAREKPVLDWLTGLGW